MSLKGRTISHLAQPFEGGSGPSHGTLNRIWAAEDAAEYLGEGNKMARVLQGLQGLRDGRRAAPGEPALPADAAKLACVASELAGLLLASGLVAEEDVAEALDGRETCTDPTRRSAAVTAAPTAAAGPRDRGDGVDLESSELAPPASRQLVDDPRQVMVVHGRDIDAARAVFDWLRAVVAVQLSGFP